MNRLFTEYPRSLPCIALFAAATMLLTLVGCERSTDGAGKAATNAQTARTDAETSGAATGGIDWFSGGPELAFAKSQEEGRNILVFFGTDWCPGCNFLKAHVFTRPDLIVKTRSLIPLYLDGDDPATQRWAEEFNVLGFPTSVLLRPDRTEIERIVGSTDPSKYGAVLDIALKDQRSPQQLFDLMTKSGKRLTLDECRRLAYAQWSISSATDSNSDSGPLQGDPAMVAKRCPDSAREDRARLTIWALRKALRAEEVALRAGEAPSPKLVALLRDQYTILSDTDLAPVFDGLFRPDEKYFEAAERAGVVTKDALREQWITLLERRERDPDRLDVEQLSALLNRLRLIESRDGAISASMKHDAIKRGEEVLAKTQDRHARMPVIDAVVAILNQLGEMDRAVEILMAESGQRETSFHYLGTLASIEEKRGNTDKALEWREKAYEQAQGAERVKAGVQYISVLARHEGDSERVIRETALEMLQRIEETGLLSSRTQSQLSRLSAVLAKWNEHGAHSASVTAINERLASFCGKAAAVAGMDEGTCRQSLLIVVPEKAGTHS